VPVENYDAWMEDPFSALLRTICVGPRSSGHALHSCDAGSNLVKLYEEGFQPKGDLILLVVSDEESGGTYGTEWMLKNHPKLVETDYAITEQVEYPSLL